MLFILLPAFNEEEGLEKLLDRIDRIIKGFSIQCKIIIVNDGSMDRTLYVIDSYAKTLPIEIINFKNNHGITEVFRVGFKRVCEIGKDNDICITMDSDNTQNPYVILDIIDKINNSSDVVIASRFQKGGKMVGAPLLRKLMSVGVAKILKQVVPIKGVSDYSTFYRGYRVKVLKQAFSHYGDNLIEGQGFSSMANLLIKLRKITQRFAEVPFILRYDLKEGGSGIRVIKTIKGYLKIISEVQKGKL
ncbi:MAG: glycosyltransferase [Candidatus Omnitrophica bacterium]|nr:glycosyltransferase [Candidatus Omnitrophota bacterium]MDD5652708.1 glycosyltransferase [Candidatus Omnitrophota bacterium]